MAMANGTYTGDWETFVKHEAGGGSFYLQSRYRTDLWMGIENRRIRFVAEGDRKPLSYGSSNQGDDPKMKKTTLRIGSHYIKVNEKSQLVTVEDASAATQFQVMTLSDADGKDYGVGLRHVVGTGTDRKYGYVYGLFGYPYGYWARNIIMAHGDGYEKDLSGYQYWIKTDDKQEAKWEGKQVLDVPEIGWRPYTADRTMEVFVRGGLKRVGLVDVGYGKSFLQYSLKLKTASEKKCTFWLIWEAGLKGDCFLKCKRVGWFDATGAFGNFQAFFDEKEHCYPNPEFMLPTDLQDVGSKSWSVDNRTGEQRWPVNPFGDNYYEVKFQSYVYVGQYKTGALGEIYQGGLSVCPWLMVKVIKATVTTVKPVD